MLHLSNPYTEPKGSSLTKPKGIKRNPRPLYYTYRYQLCSLFPGNTHSSCVHLKYLLFFFVGFARSYSKLGDFVGSLHISFPSSNLPPYGLSSFPCICTSVPSSIGFPLVPIFLPFEAPPGEMEPTIRPSLHNSLSSPPWECGVG